MSVISPIISKYIARHNGTHQQNVQAKRSAIIRSESLSGVATVRRNNHPRAPSPFASFAYGQSSLDCPIYHLEQRIELENKGESGSFV
jgi:hypothetical protein